MLSMLHRLPVKKGDFVFVNGGVPHAIGAGCFMIELQEPSDLMVVNERFTPSGREIPEIRLHMGLGYEKMFDVYDYTGYSLEELKERYCPKPKKILPNVYQILGTELTEKFSMYLLKQNCSFNVSSKYRIGIVTSGEGTVNGTEVKKGDRLFIMNEDAIALNGSENFEVVLCQ